MVGGAHGPRTSAHGLGSGRRQWRGLRGRIDKDLIHAAAHRNYPGPDVPWVLLDRHFECVAEDDEE